MLRRGWKVRGLLVSGLYYSCPVWKFVAVSIADTRVLTNLHVYGRECSQQHTLVTATDYYM